MERKKEIKTRVSVMETLMSIPVGKSVNFSVRDMLLTSVRSAVSRLNADTPGRFVLLTDQFGINYTIHRIKK